MNSKQGEIFVSSFFINIKKWTSGSKTGHSRFKSGHWRMRVDFHGKNWTFADERADIGEWYWFFADEKVDNEE